jgi:hypothetical protein
MSTSPSHTTSKPKMLDGAGDYKLPDYHKRNLDICQICGNNFNVGERIPRILVNCGHTFCTKCLTSVFNHNRIRCPICSKLMKNLESVERLPLNINILDEIVNKDAMLKNVYFDEEEEEDSKFCTHHPGRIKHFFCSNHRTIFCRECIRIDHIDEACFVVDLYEIQKMKQIHNQNIFNNLLQSKRSQEKNLKKDDKEEQKLEEDKEGPIKLPDTEELKE